MIGEENNLILIAIKCQHFTGYFRNWGGVKRQIMS